MKKIFFLLAMLFSANLFADLESGYQMYFNPLPDDGSCEITSITMKPFIVTINSYNYPLREFDYSTGVITMNKQSSGAWKLWQNPYKKNQTWDAYYTYKKHGRFFNKRRRGVVKNIPKGKAMIHLPCGRKFSIERFKQKFNDGLHNPKVREFLGKGYDTVKNGGEILQNKMEK